MVERAVQRREILASHPHLANRLVILRGQDVARVVPDLPAKLLLSYYSHAPMYPPPPEPNC